MSVYESLLKEMNSLKRQLGMTKSELKNIGQVPLNERKELFAVSSNYVQSSY